MRIPPVLLVVLAAVARFAARAFAGCAAGRARRRIRLPGVERAAEIVVTLRADTASDILARVLLDRIRVSSKARDKHQDRKPGAHQAVRFHGGRSTRGMLR